MDIIIKHKKAFIILVIVAAVLVGFIGTGLMAFSFGIGSSEVIEVTNEEVNYEPRKVQQDTKYAELDFSNGPVVFSESFDDTKNVTNGGGDIMVAYLEKGDVVDFSITSKVKKGSLGYDFISKDGNQYSGNVMGSYSSGDSIAIEEDGNYVFDYTMNDFKGTFEMTITVKRDE